MFNLFQEQFLLTEEECIDLIYESDEFVKSNVLREFMNNIDECLQKADCRNAYIQYGDTFLNDNSDMLSKKYPAGKVKWPIKYIDNCLALFGYTNASLKKILIAISKEVSAVNNFKTFTEVPINTLHAMVMLHAEKLGYHKLKESAKQQLGMSIYSLMFNKYFAKKVMFNEKCMEYTYMHLSNKYDIKHSESVIDWILGIVQSCYEAYWKKLLLTPTPKLIVDFMNRLRNSFNQTMCWLASKYYENIENKNYMADEDTSGNGDQTELTGNLSKVRSDLIGLLKNGDELYAKENSNLYSAISDMRHVKKAELYRYSQLVKYSDLGNIIDKIFYVFIIQEGNSLADINSTKFISRIKTMPSAVDRCISGEPVIIPLRRKYGYDGEIVKAHICLMCVYIMQRINKVKK